MRRAAIVLAAAAPWVAAAAGTSAAGQQAPRLPDLRLSDERTLSHWASPRREAQVRVAPRLGTRVIARLHHFTEDGYPEIYLLLSQHMDGSGRVWVRLRLPGRPNGRTGWVPRDALGDSHLVHTFLLIDRRALRLTLYAWGRPVFRAPVGVGKPATPTPAGRFWIREKYRVKPGTLYGVRAIGTSAYSRISDWPRGGVVGLHGTDKPQLIPGRPSHGCIRLRNRDVVRLYRLLPIGTPVRIR
jgi:hypothetical protein